jgi:hypothetical protein
VTIANAVSRSGGWSPRASAFWLALPSVLVVLPLWSVRYLPFADLPEHAAVSAALAHWNDPAWRASEFYSFSVLATPYWLYDLLGAILTRCLGDAFMAHRVMLTAVGLVLPWSAAALLRALSCDPRLGALASVYFWNRALQYGLLPFMASIPMLLFSLAWYVRLIRSGERISRLRLLAACVGSLCMPLLHVTTFVVYGLTTFGYALVAEIRALRAPQRAGTLGRAARSVRWCVPLLGIVVFLAYGVGSVRSGFVGRDSHFAPWWAVLASVPSWAFNVWMRRDEKAFAALYWAGVLGIFVSGYRSRARHTLFRAWPLLASVVLLLVIPFQVGAGFMLNTRLGPLIGVLLLPLLRLGASRYARLSLFVALVGVSGQSLVAFFAIRDSQAELGGFPAIVNSVPFGSRILYLPYDQTSQVAHFFPWRHQGATIRAERGGLSQFSFASMAHWPIHDRLSPGKSEVFWDHLPCLFDRNVDGAFYDVLLVRGAYDPFLRTQEAARHPMGNAFELTAVEPPFYVWQRVGTAKSHVQLPQAVSLTPAPCESGQSTQGP